jgi:hypothetical protein
LYERLKEAVGQVPGVSSVSIATNVPFKNITAGIVSIPGRDSASIARDPVQVPFVDADYAS